MQPLDWAWHEEAIFLPGHACLYDRSGRRIDASQHFLEGQALRHVPPRVTLPAELARIDEPVVLGGHLPKHFGHFLLESLERLWVYPQLELRRLPFVHFRERFHVHEQDLLRALLDRYEAPLLALTRPTVLSSVLVPEQGIRLGEDYHRQMTVVYDEIRTSLIGPVGEPDPRPVYLSRTRLPRGYRRTLGEPALEQRLAAHGIRIVHPQELPLVEQVRLVAHARDVIGPDGTALHLTILRSLPGSRTLALNTRTPEINQLRVDRLRGADHRHLHVQFPINPRAPHVLGGRELELTNYRSFVLPARAERQVMRELAR